MSGHASSATLLVAAAVLFLAVWAGTGSLQRLLLRRGIVDRPNSRSSHDQPKPRGAGLCLIPAIMGAWIFWTLWADRPAPGLWWVLVGAFLLGAVSWRDDLRGLSPALRLAVQLAAVALGLAGLAESGPVFQGLLPFALDRLAAGLLWLWFINLFNFMDGIDGISGVESLAIATGLVLVSLLGGFAPAFLPFALLLGAGVAGFLPWNWSPARIFLGDVGSVPLGYLIGWLLLIAATEGAWAAALILPAYYLADASLTLLRRATRGETIWRAHRAHAYQRAVQGGLSHRRVAGAVAALNLVLIGLALLVAPDWPWAALAAAALAVLVLLAYFGRAGSRAKPAG